MRFYTASPLVARQASEDVEVGGYLLPKVRDIIIFGSVGSVLVAASIRKKKNYH